MSILPFMPDKDRDEWYTPDGSNTAMAQRKPKHGKRQDC